MLKERREIVEGLRDQLHETEMAVESALVAIGQLVTALPIARAKANISPVAGQAAFDSMAAALAGIVRVRGHMVDAHGHLEQTRGQFRMPVVGAGRAMRSRRPRSSRSSRPAPRPDRIDMVNRRCASGRSRP